jgi:hypothetical protein
MSYTPQSDASVQRSMARSMEGSIKIMNGIGQTGLLNDVAGSVHQATNKAVNFQANTRVYYMSLLYSRKVHLSLY